MMPRFAGRARLVIPAVIAIWAGLAFSGDLAKAPDFTLNDLKGTPFTLSAGRGEGATLINFWATWCGPCLREMKTFKKLDETYGPKGLKIVAISIDDQKTASQVRGVVRSRRFSFTVLTDPNQDVMRSYQVTVPPFTALLDSQGHIVYTHEGYKDGDEDALEARIVALLESKE